MREPPAILILAAGASSRMRGTDKLLEEIDGAPLLARAACAAHAAVENVLVALPAADRFRRAVLTDLPCQLIDVTDCTMSASIRAGVAACPSDAILIHLADMPDIDAVAFKTLVDAWRASATQILRAVTDDGRAGQPVIFARSLFPSLLRLGGDKGAQVLLGRHAITEVPLLGQAALTDLDTPEAWAAWRAARG